MMLIVTKIMFSITGLGRSSNIALDDERHMAVFTWYYSSMYIYTLLLLKIIEKDFDSHAGALTLRFIVSNNKKKQGHRELVQGLFLS